MHTHDFTTTTESAEIVGLLVRHQRDLLRFILPLVGCPEDAEDVLQEAAKAIWAKGNEYDRSRPFLPWARQFAMNQVLMHRRSRRKSPWLAGDVIEQLAGRQQERDDLSEVRRVALRMCLQKLPEEDRRLIEGRYQGSNETIQDVASATGRTANAIYKELGRIRRVLLECITRMVATEAV